MGRHRAKRGFFSELEETQGLGEHRAKREIFPELEETQGLGGHRAKRDIFRDLATLNTRFPLQKCKLTAKILKIFRLRRALFMLDFL